MHMPLPELYFDPETGLRLKVDGQRRVLENAEDRSGWRSVMMAFARGLLLEWAVLGRREITSDDLRYEAWQRGLPIPHHSNAWGGLFTSLRGRGLIRDTGRAILSQRADAHGRKITVWEVLDAD
jgi:hypothetical protein